MQQVRFFFFSIPFSYQLCNNRLYIYISLYKTTLHPPAPPHPVYFLLCNTRLRADTKLGSKHMIVDATGGAGFPGPWKLDGKAQMSPGGAAATILF